MKEVVEEEPRMMGLVISAAVAHHRWAVCTQYLEEERNRVRVACCRVVMLSGVMIVAVGLNS